MNSAKPALMSKQRNHRRISKHVHLRPSKNNVLKPSKATSTYHVLGPQYSFLYHLLFSKIPTPCLLSNPPAPMCSRISTFAGLHVSQRIASHLHHSISFKRSSNLSLLCIDRTFFFLKNNTVRLCVGACSSFLLLLLFSRLCCYPSPRHVCSCGRYSCVWLIRRICRWCSSRRRGLVLWWLWIFLGGCSVARRCECVKEHRVLLLMFHHRVCGCCFFRLDSYNTRWNVVEGGYECCLASDSLRRLLDGASPFVIAAAVSLFVVRFGCMVLVLLHSSHRVHDCSLSCVRRFPLFSSVHCSESPPSVFLTSICPSIPRVFAVFLHTFRI